jgi:hypothetical protein
MLPRALVNPRNHRLNGRDLVVEYASPDAVRRGGGPRNTQGDWGQKSRNGNGRIPQRGSTNMPYAKQRRPRHTEQEDVMKVAEIPAQLRIYRKHRTYLSAVHTHDSHPEWTTFFQL